MTYSFRTNGNFIDFVHTDNTNQAVESVLRSLHNTSRCVTWSLPEDTTRISFVIDDIRVDNFLLTEIDFDGTAINSQDDFETGITAMFTGLAGGGSSYLVDVGNAEDSEPLDGTEELGIIQEGELVKTTTQDIADLASASPFSVYRAILTQTGTDAPVATVLQNSLSGPIVWAYTTDGTYAGTLNNAFPLAKTWINVTVNASSAMSACAERASDSIVNYFTLEDTFSGANGNIVFMEIIVYP